MTVLEESDECSHLQLGRFYLTLFGLWPVNYIGAKKVLYNWYFKITFSCFCLFLITQAVESYICLKTNLVQFAGVFSVFLGYFMSIVKVRNVKSDKFRSILSHIVAKEKKIMECLDHNIIDIYNENVKSTKKLERTLLTITVSGGSIFYIQSVLSHLSNNSNGEHLIVESWFPFDRREHYWKAYIIQCVSCTFATFYMFFTMIFFSVILKFLIGQFKILNYQFRNFTKTSQIFREVERLGPDAQYQIIFLKTLIKEHQTLISLAYDFNTCMQTLMLLDFLVTSFQLAMIAFQITQISGLERMAMIILFLATSIYICSLYWNGNEMAFQSQEISMSILQSDWNTYEKTVTKMLQLVMLRSQKPVRMRIGPVGNAEFRAFIQIYKAVYSYVCVFGNVGR